MNYFNEAISNLLTTRIRTLLAMIGILVGTASVVAMVSVGQLATRAALDQFKTLGTDMLAVSIYSQGDSSSSNPFDLQAALNLKNVSKNILSLAPYTTPYTSVLYHGQPIDTAIVGATHNLEQVIGIHMQQGRFISDYDNFSAYCVVGNQIYQKLKAYDLNPLGSQIKLGNTIFTVVGVTQPWPENDFFQQDINNSIIIPIKTSGLLSKYATIQNIVMRLSPNANIDDVKTKITQYLGQKAPKSQVMMHSAKELIQKMTAQHRIFTLLLGLIGSITLIVGGVGVMNIMFVSVLERRREIGLRLALGAKRHDIQWMFLGEAVILSVSGGIFGIILGILCSFIIAEFAHWHFSIFLLPPVIGFTVSVLIGVFFGFYPARQASQLDPIQTLRTE